MSTQLSELKPAQRDAVLKTLCQELYNRVRELQIEIEQLETGRAENYGVNHMTNRDRLRNRLVVDLVLSDMGIPAHDKQALEWLANVAGLKTP